MKKETSGVVVVCSFKPKPGMQAELIGVLKEHVPTLRQLGLATGYPQSLLSSENGTVLEIFEWVSEKAAESAHGRPEVQKLWERVGKIADICSLDSLSETKKPFAHFKLECDAK